MALSSMGTVFFTAFATLTGTARSGAFAAVFALQDTLTRDAASRRTRAVDDFLSLFDGDFFMISLASRYLCLPSISAIPRTPWNFKRTFYRSFQV
jgi:hypothetical protein